MADTYKIVRFYQRDTKPNRVITRGLTLEQAQAHCSSPETSSKTATGWAEKLEAKANGPWFDGYERETE